MTQEQKKMVFGCALGESITHPTWGSYPLLEEAIRKCDGQLSAIYVTDELISEFNAYVLKKAAATPPPQGLAWVKAKEGDKFDSRSVVRFIHTKFAIQDAAGFIKRFPHRIDTLEYLVESAPAPQTDASQLREELEGAKKDNEAFKREFTEAMDDVARLGGENEKLQKEIERVKGLLPGGENCECVIPKPIDPYHPIDKHICRDCNGKINDNNL